jgi:hypothetical protein
MTETFQNARAGTQFRNAFECYQDSPTGTRTALVSGRTDSCDLYNTGTVGNTLAQDLAAANVDGAVIFWGTNENGNTGNTGSPGDLYPAQDTIYGRALWVLKGIQAARPSMRILVVEQYQNAFAANFTNIAAVKAAVEYAALQIGAPTVDLSATSGISFYLESIALTDTVDGTHPSTSGGKKIAGPIAGAIDRYWQF